MAFALGQEFPVKALAGELHSVSGEVKWVWTNHLGNRMDGRSNTPSCDKLVLWAATGLQSRIKCFCISTDESMAIYQWCLVAKLPDEFFLALDCSLIQQKHTAQKDWSQPSNTSHQWVTICWLAVIKIIKYTKVVQLKLAGEVSIVKSSKEPKGWLHRKVTLHVILYHDIALFHLY